MAPRARRLEIHTPEGVVFSLELAGPVTRFCAWFVDALAILALIGAANQLMFPLMLGSPGLAMAMQALAAFAISQGYRIALEWGMRGQTPGKRLFRLRVMDGDGLRLTFGQVVLRNLLRPADQLPVAYLVGGVAMLLSRESKRLGDLAAGTVVVRVPRPLAPDLETIREGRHNSLREHPSLEARLRAAVTPAEASVALAALLRRERLSPEARLEVFGRVADRLRSLVALPPEAVEGVSDEQFTRNAVEAIFRSRHAARAEAAPASRGTR